MPSDIVAGRQPGFWSQAFGKVYQLANDTGGQVPWGAGQPKSWKEQGTGLIEAGYKGIEFPDHFSPWPNVYWGSDLGQVIPTPLHVLGRISPICFPLFPVLCAFSPS